MLRAPASPLTSVWAHTGLEDSGKARGVKSQAPKSTIGSAGIYFTAKHNDCLEALRRAQIKISPEDRRDGLQ